MGYGLRAQSWLRTGPRQVSRRYSLFLNTYFVAVFVGIGGLQMYRVNAGFLTNYGADLFAPPYLYLMLRGGRFRLRAPVALTTVLGGCFLWEWMQRYDLSGTLLAITRGTFDPFDLLAYTVGLVVIYVIDIRWLEPRQVLPGPQAMGQASEPPAAGKG